MDQPTISTRSPDGRGNHLFLTDLGAAGTEQMRLGPVSYSDGLGAMTPGAAPPRAISNAIADQSTAGDIANPQGVSNLFWVWGQFIDHDITLTPEGHTEFIPIVAPAGDPAFPPGSVIPFMRSEPMDSDGGTLSFTNEITAFIDASMVYGSDAQTAAALRGDGGFLKTGANNLLPDAPDPDDDDGLLAGDVRAGENVALTALHTIFVREHNRQVTEIAKQHPGLSADELYGAARARVEAIVQAITYNEFLPLLVGRGTMTAYAGYNPNVDPSISIEFSTAAFRLGHSLLSTTIERIDETGDQTADGPLSLRDAFFRPDLLRGEDALEDILRGLAGSHAQALDTMIVEDVRSFLFGDPGDGGLDLVSLNIQRGRDHGLPAYNDLREAVGLTRAKSFDDVTSDPVLQQKLITTYGTVNAIDAWIGGLAEDPVDGGMLGELFARIVVDQFERLRAGDRFWSEAILTEEERDDLWSTTLSDVIVRTTGVKTMQDHALKTYERMGGTTDADAMAGSAAAELMMGSAGNDLLHGMAGDDAIEGGAGNDVMDGGAGADVFMFDARDGGIDLISDFEPGIDRIEITGLDDGDMTIIADLAPGGGGPLAVQIQDAQAEARLTILLTGLSLDDFSDLNDLFVL